MPTPKLRKVETKVKAEMKNANSSLNLDLSLSPENTGRRL